MEGFKPSNNNEKKAPDPLPEIESTLQELEVRKAQLPEEGQVRELEPTEEQDLKDTVHRLLEK